MGLDILGLGILFLFTVWDATTGDNYGFSCKYPIEITPLPNDFSVRTDGYDMQGDVFATVFQSSLHRVTQTTAAWNGHPGDCDGSDIVVLENLRQLFSVVHCIQLGAANQRYLILHEIMVKIAVGIGGTVSGNQ